MKKRTLKKMLTTVAVTLLFSSTVAYGAAGEFNWTLHQTQVEYTSSQEKMNTVFYAKVTQTSISAVTEYTVVNTSYQAVSGTWSISNAGSRKIWYAQEDADIIFNNPLKLKAYNNPAKNNGGVRNVAGTWTP